MTVWEAESVPVGFYAASSNRSLRNVLISGQSSVSDGQSQPADLSTGCISLP